MKIFNKLLSLHARTLCSNQNYGNAGLAKRLYSHRYEINRIGKNYDDLNRRDVHISAVLSAYLARKIFINEKYFLFEEDKKKEEQFTTGLWDIYCYEVLDRKIPELNVPTTYNELEKIFMNKHIYLEYSQYTMVQEAVLHNQLVDSNDCKTMKDFDLHCSLPGYAGWTAIQEGIARIDGRKGSPVRLIQMAIGMYMYDVKKTPEPYLHFWKSKAEQLILKSICLLENTLIIKFRNATMYEMFPIPRNFIPVEKFHWNVKK